MADDPNKPAELKRLEEAQAALNKQYAATQQHLKALQQLEVPTAEQAAEIEKLTQAQFNLSEEIRKAAGPLKKQTELYAEQNKVLEAKRELLNKAEAATQKLNSGVDSLVKGMGSLVGLDIPTSIGGFASAFVKLGLSIDQTRADMRKATGFTSKLDGQLMRARKTANRFGQSMADTGKAISSANASITLFAGAGDAAQSAMVDTTITLQGLGADAADVGKSIDYLSRGMNMSATAAAKTTLEFDTLAQSVGLPTGQIVKDFATMAPQLAKFGRRGTIEFRKLSRQARSLGVSVKQMFDIGEQMDTFEGAADLTGKLNAQLGLRLNSIELMKASEADRIDMLRAEFKMRGKNFKDMNRWEKKAVAEIMKVDVDTAARLFGSPADLAKYKAEQKGINERMEKMNSLTDKFRGIMENLFEKMAPKLEKFLEYLSDVAKKFDPASIEKWGSTIKNWLLVIGGLLFVKFVGGIILAGSQMRKMCKTMGDITTLMKTASGTNPFASASIPQAITAGAPPVMGDNDPGLRKSRPQKGPGRMKKGMGGLWGKIKGLGSTLKKGKGFFGKFSGILGGAMKLSKKLPGIGLLVGGGMALQKLLQGDFTGAGLEIASGAASMVPGLGTAASMAIDAAAMSREQTQSDFIMRGNKVTPFHKDDIIMGGTSLLGGKGGGATQDSRAMAKEIGKEVSKAVESALKSQAASRNIKLMLNERELGNVVADLINTKYNLTTA